MSRKAILQLVLPLIGLSVLFCLLAFAPGEKHSQPPLLEMSVILRDGDGGVSTMRKGMEQAAEDLNVELRFLTPAEDNNAAEQVLLLEREVAGGAPAVVLLPADRELLSGAVSAAAGKTTLVTVETDMTAWGAAASVSMDHHALGEALGTAAMHGVPTGGTVLLLDSLPGDNGIRERLEAAREVLEREGRQVREYQWSGDEALFADILRIERPGAIIAFEAAALAEVAELSRGENFPLLYGCGSTTGIAAALEKGRVTAIAAVNVFSAGYLAVEAAASLARHEDWTGAPTVAFSVVRQETMYESDNQKLLFPVT
mgnify:FL=1